MILIKSFEGFRPRAVQEDDGRWVIGYGHSASAREGLTVAEADAELLLQYDLLPVVKALNEQVNSPLNQHQFDALASFAVSVGVDRFLDSDVLQRLNQGDPTKAADALTGWPEDPSANARIRRRAAERALFNSDPASPVTLAELLAAPLPATSADSVPPDRSSDTVAPGPTPPHPSWAPEPPAFESPVFQPAAAVTRVNLDRYSPYAAVMIGPLPGFASAETVEPPATPEAPTGPQAADPEPDPLSGTGTTSEPGATEAEPVGRNEPPVPAGSVASPFPPMEEGLILTPATEADFVETERPIWPSDQRAGTPSAEDVVLFEEEPTLSVLRHEVEPAPPRRFDWSETGAFLIMGGVGLAACGASAAAFRLAVEQPSPMGETSVIAWALALIGVICVGVSSWNLYVRWGKPD